MPAPRKSTTKNGVKKTAPASPSASATSISIAELPSKMTAPVAPKTTVSKAPVIVVKSSAQQKSSSGKTEIVAQADVGFGNTLSIRGQGAGLNWDKGQPMEWLNGAWVWTTNSNQGFEFKVLINDQTWAQGDNMSAKVGSKVVFKPVF